MHLTWVLIYTGCLFCMGAYYIDFKVFGMITID